MSSYYDQLAIARLKAENRKKLNQNDFGEVSSNKSKPINKKLERPKPNAAAIAKYLGNKQKLAEKDLKPVQKEPKKVVAKKDDTKVKKSAKQPSLPELKIKSKEKLNNSSGKEKIAEKKIENGKKRKTETSTLSSKKPKLESNNNKKVKPQLNYYDQLALAANKTKAKKSSEPAPSVQKDKSPLNKDKKQDKYLEWGLTDEEVKWYHKLNDKANRCADRGKEVKFDSYETKIKNRIDKKRKAYKNKLKLQNHKLEDQKKMRPSTNNYKPSTQSEAPQKPKPLNPYAKAELYKGKKTKPSEPTKLPANCVVSVQSSTPTITTSAPQYRGGRKQHPGPSRQEPPRNSYMDGFESEDEYDSEFDDFIDNGDEDVDHEIVSKLLRKTCKGIFTMKDGKAYNTGEWARRETGLSDYALERSMTSSNRQILVEEKVAAARARREERDHNLKHGYDRANNYESD